MSSSSVQTLGDLTVRIERDLCIGSGNCVKVVGEILELDAEQIASFREGAAAAGATREQVIEACMVCPVGALLCHNAEGRQLVP